MDISLITIVLSFILSILISLNYLPSFKKSKVNGEESPQSPPGKTGLPFIGETLDFISACKKGVPERFVFDRIEKYSSKVFKTSLFGETIVVISTPEGNKFLFSNENKLVQSWWPRALDVIFGRPGDENINEINMRSHELLSRYFNPGSFDRSVEIMDIATKQHLQTYWEGRDVIEVHPLAKHFTCAMVCKLFLGIEDQDVVTRIDKLLSQIINGLLALPVNIPGTKFNRALKAKAKMQKEIDGFIKKWKSDVSAQRTSDSESVLAEFLRKTVRDDEISTMISSLFFAAYESTSSVLSSIIRHLGELPHVYDKVLAEQREIARSKECETLNWIDIQRMKYSRNVISELLRISSPGPGAFKEAICDFTYDGFLIQKGWKLHWNTYGIHRSSEYFIDPNKFDPSRFEGDGPMPYSFVPFGGGNRMCPGKEYVRLQALVFMHNVVTKFRWKKVFLDEKFICDPGLKPAKNLPIHLYPYNM